MNNLQKLIASLATDEQVIRFKQLEIIIDQNEELQEGYAKLLHYQKIMVQREAKKHPDYLQSKEQYETQKKKIMKYFIINEYLDLLENINSDLSLIQTIIEQEMNIDFD